MTNPATQLADQLDAWDIGIGQSAEAARSLSGGDSLAFWRRHGKAVELLLDIERSLGGLEAAGHDVTHWWQAVPSWYRAVFAVDTPWSTGYPNGRPALQPASMSLLRVLGTFLEYSSAVPQILPADVPRMKAALAEIEDLVKVSSELDDSVRHYMLSLIWELRICLDEIDTFGSVAPRSQTFELAGVMFSRAHHLAESDPEASKTWGEKARVLVGTVLGAVGLKAVEGGAGETVKAILE